MPSKAHDPVRILMAEHEAIQCVLDGLEAAVRAVRSGNAPAPALLAEMIWFLREYADGRHHAKEEGLLFPALEANGIPSRQGPTAAMRSEHSKGRLLTGCMDACLRGDGPKAHSAWNDFAGAAESYVGLLRSHIGKEDHCLFAIASSLLGPIERRQLAAAFRRVDAQWEADRGPRIKSRLNALLRACGRLQEGDPAGLRPIPAEGLLPGRGAVS